MIRFVARRIGLICLTLLVVSLVIFVVTEILPGDVAVLMLKESATPEGLARIRTELGLYAPAHVRYLRWIGMWPKNDWGFRAESSVGNLSVTPDEVGTGETVTISAQVFNLGDNTSDYKVMLRLDGTTLETKTVTLDAGASQVVAFTTSRSTEGTYTVGTDGFSNFSGILQGDWGNSYVHKKPITDIMGRRLWHSAILGVFAFLIGVPAALVAGIWAGVRPDTKLDRLLSMTSLMGISVPEFVTGVLLMLLLATTLHLLPPSSLILPGTSPLSRPQILVLPTLTITAVMFGYIMRMTRANVIEVMQTDYVRTAILKGLPMRRVIFRHVLQNAMLPTITIIATNFGWMLGGLIIVENVFAYPGIGQLVLQSINTRDIPLLEGVVLLVGAIYAFCNLGADLSYAVLDPRVRLT